MPKKSTRPIRKKRKKTATTRRRSILKMVQSISRRDLDPATRERAEKIETIVTCTVSAFEHTGHGVVFLIAHSGDVPTDAAICAVASRTVAQLDEGRR